MPGNEESCGDEEGKRAIVAPLVVRTIDVRIDPLTVVVAVGVEHVRIAVGMYEAPPVSPLSIECSPDCISFAI